MEPDYIIRSLRNIEHFFQAYPEAQAITGIANHIRDFWDPRMVQDLKQTLETAPETLPPLSLKAAQQMCLG